MTCDAHFRTQMSYSSQKLCVKIWFRLVEIGGMLILRGTRNPLLGGLHVTCDAHFRTWPSFSNPKSCVKIWFGLVVPFKSYRGNKQRQKKKENEIKTKIWFGLVGPFKSYRVHKQTDKHTNIRTHKHPKRQNY